MCFVNPLTSRGMLIPGPGFSCSSDRNRSRRSRNSARRTARAEAARTGRGGSAPCDATLFELHAVEAPGGFVGGWDRRSRSRRHRNWRTACRSSNCPRGPAILQLRPWLKARLEVVRQVGGAAGQRIVSIGRVGARPPGLDAVTLAAVERIVNPRHPGALGLHVAAVLHAFGRDGGRGRESGRRRGHRSADRRWARAYPCRIRRCRSSTRRLRRFRQRRRRCRRRRFRQRRRRCRPRRCLPRHR